MAHHVDGQAFVVLLQRGKHGQGEDQVAERARPDDQDAFHASRSNTEPVPAAEARS